MDVNLYAQRTVAAAGYRLSSRIHMFFCEGNYIASAPMLTLQPARFPAAASAGDQAHAELIVAAGRNPVSASSGL